MRRDICVTLSGVHIHLTQASGSCSNFMFILFVESLMGEAELKQNTLLLKSPGPTGLRVMQRYIKIL